MEFPTQNNQDLVIPPDERLGAVIDALPHLARSSADRPAEFWDQQRAAILFRVSANQNSVEFRSPRLAWAMAAAVLAIAACLLALQPRLATTPQAQSDPDRDLLIEVEYAVEGGGPQALEPAALLDAEINRYQQNSSLSPAPKEVNDEE
jgi:hypothetical protein